MTKEVVPTSSKRVQRFSWFMKTFISLLAFVAPFSFFHLLSIAFHFVLDDFLSPSLSLFPVHAFSSSKLLSIATPSLPIRLLLGLWMFSEALFYLYFHFEKRIVQHRNTAPPLTKEKKKELLEKCMEVAGEGKDFEKFLVGWFPGSSFNNLHRENVQEWLAWAFFNSTLEEVKQMSESHHSDEPSPFQQLEDIIDYVQKAKKVQFLSGKNPNATCLRLNIDPILAIHRPLVIYICIYFMYLLSSLVLRCFGFTHHQISRSISYWYRPASSASTTESEDPLVFIHGVGIGLTAYLPLIYALLQELKSSPRDLFLLELPHISMRITKHVPDSNEVVTSVVKMIDQQRGTPDGKFSIAGHSFGSIICTWLLEKVPKRISHVTLIDPVSILLVYADVAYNFVYRPPADEKPLDLFLWYFAKSELYLLHSIQRHFWWFENNMFPSSLAGVSHQVILSENDSIVPSLEISKHLQMKGHNMHIFQQFEHGQFLFHPPSTRMVAQMCLQK